jgi:anti-sigma factor RsiW
MKRHLDEGLLQAYLDGELSHAQAAEAAAHVAACQACAATLADAEQENSLFAAAFAPDDSLSVPSEHLRSRINAAVAQLESTDTAAGGVRSRGWSLGGFTATLAGLFNFTPQGAVAFASLLAVVAFALVYFALQRPRPATDGTQDARQVASVNPPTTLSLEVKTTSPEVRTAPPSNDDGTVPVATVPEQRNEGAAGQRNAGAGYLKASYGAGRPASRAVGARRPSAAPASKEQLLPGEKDYQTAIASLEQTIKMGGDAALRPSVRAAYERNLAILDDAISQTRQVASQNPKDRVAVGFLLETYRNKVELLTKVADQAQMAALGR